MDNINNDDSKRGTCCMMCGKSGTEENPLIKGNYGYVCAHCIRLANQVLDEQGILCEKDDSSSHDIEDLTIPKPNEIKHFLDQYVIGQNDVKRRLSTAVYNHYKRINQCVEDDDTEIEKSNILLIGGTGTGKTYIAQTIARLLNVPFAIADATSITQAGYVGDDVESILSKLLQAADGDVALAERGIVFIDEIDKIAKRTSGTSITRDVSGEGVQQALLKLLEGTIVGVPPQGGRKHPEKPVVQMNTKNILFICGGAFDGIEDIIKQRVNKKSCIGYAIQTATRNDDKNILDKVTAQDIRTFGLIPEFVGRLPIITHTNLLDEDAMLQILTEPKNSLMKQYTKLFKLDGIELTIDKPVLELVANIAIKNETGARGLRGIMECLMDEAMYDAPSSDEDKLTITMPYAKKRLSHLIDDVEAA